jgi:hypothetical protein
MKKTLPLLVALLLATVGLFAQLQFEPGSVDFGQKPITSTTNIEVVITSQINQQVTLSGLSAPFTATPATFAIIIGEQKTVTLTFNPQSAGSFAGTLTATGSIWGTTQMQVSGYAIPATVSFSQQYLDFGNILMTGYSEQMIYVQSDIAQQVTLSGLELPFAASPSTINLLPNQMAPVYVSFYPTEPDFFMGSLQATGNLSGTAQAEIYGTGDPASIFAFPQSLEFSSLFSGETDTLEIIVTTDINQNITLSGLSGVFSFNPTNLTMIAGEAQTVLVSFNPTNPGSFYQNLQLDGSLYGTLAVPVHSKCIDPKINVSVISLDFGEVPLLSPKTMQITISNTGNGTLDCSFTKGNPHFTLPQVAVSIPQGGSSSVSVIFTPEFIPAETDTLIITSNDPDNPEIRVPMSGSGLSQVSGEVCGTWYKANSPYYFTGSITVPESCTLTIEPGVVVNMFDYDFFVNGKLICNGTENDSIRLNGTGIIELGSAQSNDSLNFIVIDGGSTASDGMTLKHASSKITNSRIKAYQITNHDKTVFFDDFEDGTWQDKWISNINYQSNISLSQNFGNTGYGLSMYLGSGHYSCEIQSKPILIKNSDRLTISMLYRKTGSFYTRIYWRVNNGSWNQVFEQYDPATMSWDRFIHKINYSFQPNDLFEMRIECNYNYYYNSRELHLDDINVLSDNCSGLLINNSALNIGSFDEYSKSNDNLPSLVIHNSSVQLVENIESYMPFSSISLINSIITNSGNEAIRTNGKNSKILLDHTTIENVNGSAITTYADSTGIVVKNSTIKNCTGSGIYVNERKVVTIEIDSSLITKCSYGIYNYFSNYGNQTYSNSPVIINNSSIVENLGYGIFIERNNSPLTIDNSIISKNGAGGIAYSGNSTSIIEIGNSDISENNSYGISVFSDPTSTLFITGSKIMNNGNIGVNCWGTPSQPSYNVFIENSIVSSNHGNGLVSDYGQIYANYLTSVLNTEKGVVTSSSGTSHIFNSIICGNHQYTGLQFQGNIEFSYSKISGDPKLADSLGHLLPTSPCIDAADPTDEDTNIPFGMGTVRADMGAYGGPENWVWGGTPIPANGEPNIVKIVDLPQDQGKMVGIHYNASIFDDGHSAYDVTKYSFWRELDENGKQNIVASKTPVGQYFERGAEYWEYVGEMPAMGFQNYGYSAPTLGDSTINGMFWSKFIVVAHTANTSVYWVSQPDSGYSVDNLAPATPVNLAGTVAGVSYNLQWTPSPEQDLQYYAVYRSAGGNFEGEPFATTTQAALPNITLNTDEYEYAVAAFDHSGNRSNLSNEIAAPIYDAFTIPQGWSGISSWIMPVQPALENVLAPLSEDLVILYNQTGVYWPGQNVNTLNNWESHSGYVVKLGSEKALPMVGLKEQNTVFGTNTGWQLLPVLSPCTVPTAGLQVQPASNVVMIKEIAGWRVFWPAMGIATLGELLPGKAYFALVGSDGTIEFPACEGLKVGFENLTASPDLSAFKISATPITHTIAIPAAVSGNLEIGDALAVFDNSGTCAGVINIQDKTQASALTVFGDDQTTSTKEGMAEGETLHFKVYKSETGTFADAEVSFEPGFPNSTGTFASNGVSAISSLKVGALSTSTFENENIQVFPNPGNGKFTVSGISQGNRLEVADAKGQIIWTGISENETVINLSGRPAGLYFLKIAKTDKNSFVKLVIE